MYVLAQNIKPFLFSRDNKIKCKNCKYYMVTNNNPYLNKCTKFKKNNEINYAEDYRKKSSLCGPEGFFFEPNKEFLDKYVIDFFGDL